MLMRKLPIIRLDHHPCNPSTSTTTPTSYSPWEASTSSTSSCSSSLSSIDNIMSAKSILKDLKERRINGYERIIEEEYSMTDSTNLSSSYEEATASTSAATSSSSLIGSGGGGCARRNSGAAKMSITQQGYYSPFEPLKPVNDYVIAPNAFAEPMACLASTSINSASASPTRNSFFERIRDVFRPRSGSKSSTTSDNQQLALNGGTIEDLGEEWIHVMYYEYSEKVGQTYKSSATEISITGFCDSSTNYRFNLGSIAKPNRNPSIRYVRENIRDGVRFYNRNGDVYIDCLSNCPIFVQAPLFAHVNGQHLATVYRIAPGCSMQIFSARKFDYLIFQAQNRGTEAIAALEQICCFRLSFHKGWGENYQFQTVLEVPVWVEVLFIGALHELDSLITDAKKSQRLQLQVQQQQQHQQQQQQQQDIEDLLCPSMSIS